MYGIDMKPLLASAKGGFLLFAAQGNEYEKVK